MHTHSNSQAILFSHLTDADNDKASELEWLTNKSYAEPTESVHGDRRKRHKHSTKHSKKSKKEENVVKPELGLPPKALWLEDVGLKPEMAYRFDKGPDIDNVRYGGLYSSDIASYRRYTNHCIGLQDEVNFTDNRGKKVSKKHKKTASTRYYSGSVSKQQDAIVHTGTKDTTFEWEDSFVSFTLAEKQKSDEDADTVNPETSEWYISQRAKAYNQLLAEDPSDVSLWLEFLKFQDETYLWGCVPGVMDTEGSNDPKKQNHLALIERKIAIYEKALHSNPLAVELIVGYMSLCEEVWDQDRMIKTWRDTVFKLPQKAALWVNYILYCQRQFSFFTVAQLSTIYAKSLSTLSSLHEGFLRSHKPEDDIEESLISIVALFCLFLRGAGHTEKAVALYQALIEFNLCSPASLSSADISVKERMEFLEPFWDSGAARIGEPGAKGWRSWVEHDKREFPDFGLLKLQQIWSETDTLSPSSADDQEMELVKEKALAEAWISVETFRELQHHLPWKPSKEGEADSLDDPDRMVLFDDVSPYLFHLTLEESRLSLVQHFLNFLGVQTSAVSSDCCMGHHVMFSLVHTAQIAPPTMTAAPTSCRISDLLQGSIIPTSYCFIGKDFDGTQINNINVNDSQGPPDINTVCFIRGFLNQCLPLLSTHSQIMIFRDWLHFELSIISSSSTPKQARKKLKCVKKLAKMLLKLEAHRNNVSLWCSYAHLEMLCEGRHDAIKVCEKLLTQCSVDLESSASIPILEMYLYLTELILNNATSVDTKLQSIDTSHIKHILVCLADGKYHTYSTLGVQVASTKLLWAQNKVQQVCQKLFDMLLDYKQNTSGVRCFQHYSLLMSCLLNFNSAISCLSVAYKLFKGHCDKLVSLKPSQQHICYLERIFTTMCNLVLTCRKPESCSPQMLRCVVEESLRLFPSSTYFLDCFVNSEKRCFVAGRLRRYFDSHSPQCSTPVSWLYGIRAEWVRYQTLKEHQTDIAMDEPTSGIIHRIRSLFYRASQSPNSRCCVLLWRLYMSFEVMCT